MSTTATVEIELGGETVSLNPTLGALEALEAMGGVIAVAQRVDRLEFGAYTAVVAAGTGRKKSRALEEQVFEAGLVTLNPKLARFILILSHGGRDPDAAEDDRPAGES